MNVPTFFTSNRRDRKMPLRGYIYIKEREMLHVSSEAGIKRIGDARIVTVKAG